MKRQTNPFVAIDIALGAVFGVVFGVLMSVVFLASVIAILLVWHAEHAVPGWVGAPIFAAWGWLVAATMVKAQPIESGIVAALWAFVGGIFAPPIMLWIALSIAPGHLNASWQGSAIAAMNAAALSTQAWWHDASFGWCALGAGLGAVATWLFDFRRRARDQFFENPTLSP